VNYLRFTLLDEDERKKKEEEELVIEKRLRKVIPKNTL